jgi:hypothetical protein
MDLTFQETLDVSAVVFANILSTATVSAFNVSAIQDFTVRRREISETSSCLNGQANTVDI